MSKPTRRRQTKRTTTTPHSDRLAASQQHRQFCQPRSATPGPSLKLRHQQRREMLSRPQQRLTRAIARQQICRRLGAAANTAPTRPLSTTPPLLTTPPPSPLPTTWTSPYPSSTDFRSDVVTSPTASMLHAISTSTHLDDVFCEDPSTISLETRLASLTGHKGALLVLSGTMGNQLALRALLTQPPHAVLCDERAHILEWEAGGVASLSGALVQGVVAGNGRFLTLEDVQRKVVLSDDVHACPTRVISLENTLGGSIMPLDETRRISEWARENGILMHLDGARLWEAVVAGAGGLDDYTRCFDTVSLCFSKGLGAPIGSILLGSKEVIKRARWVRKSIGGGLRQSGVVAAAARVGVEETFLGGKLKRGHEIARRVGQMWEQKGGRLEREVETNMVWLDLEGAGVGEEEWVRAAGRRGVKVGGGRVVVHYQVTEEAVGALGEAMGEVLGKGGREGGGEKKVGFKSYG
ncbi:hypothetical protein VF21_00730 [Pseudogymnoascus sp. 05NY08]|nr:hypothetical protein VF21_00730 [Pseudogymnoascus sp. 05NY08]